MNYITINAFEKFSLNCFLLWMLLLSAFSENVLPHAEVESSQNELCHSTMAECRMYCLIMVPSSLSLWYLAIILSRPCVMCSDACRCFITQWLSSERMQFSSLLLYLSDSESEARCPWSCLRNVSPSPNNSRHFRWSDATPTVLLNKHRLISFKTSVSSAFSSPVWKVPSSVCPELCMLQCLSPSSLHSIHQNVPFFL